LVAKDAQRAVPMLEHAVADNPNVAGWWQNLGIAYQMLDRTEDAVRAFQRAAELDPKEPKYKVMMWRARLQGAAVKATAPDEDDQDASP
jgi:cytochrome c-type biogenesis protein CcmH/NrfG